MSPTKNIVRKKIGIGAPSSGSGKTIVSLIIEAGLLSLGYDVSAFKIGPDFIDPTYHRELTECYNLDPVMSSPDFVKFLFHRKSKEFNVIEGVMGLFDGEEMGGSTAEVLNMLDVPCILVVDAHGMGESIRGIVKGFSQEVKIAGVVANRVSSHHHAKIIKNALEREKIPLVGFVPKDESLSFPSRHLGLHLAYETDIREKKGRLSQIFKKYFDVKTLLQIFEMSAEQKEQEHIDDSILMSELPGKLPAKNIRAAFLTGSLFPFVYPENMMILELSGFQVLKLNIDEINCDEDFSKIRKEIGFFDVLFIPGGYPELNSHQIQERKELFRRIFEMSSSVVAECGGLEMLSRSVKVKEKEIQMLGVFPFNIEIGDRISALGWRKAILKNGKLVKGHEFHYGKITDFGGFDCTEKCILRKFDMRGNFKGYDGFITGKFLAMWFHFYFPSNPSAVLDIIEFLMKENEKY